MAWLAAAVLFWIGCHVGIAGTSLRTTLVERIGYTGFRVAFSVTSIVAIVLLIIAYNHAPYVGL